MARNKKAKEYASLASNVEPAPELGTPPAEESDRTQVIKVDPWVEGDLKLRQLAKRIETDFLEFCTVAREAMAEGWHLKFGFVDATKYFDERIGVSYRTMRRRLTILDAIERLPEGERDEARKKLVEIGAHKAAALAPLFGIASKTELDRAIEFAKDSKEEAVQSMVSEKLGRPHRGLPAQEHPGERFLRMILNMVPPEEHDRAEWVFEELMKMAGSRNPMAAFLVLLNMGEAELASIGVLRDAANTTP